MSILNQKTVKKIINFSGVGLHSGKLVKVRVNECNQHTLFGELISNNEYKECAA